MGAVQETAFLVGEQRVQWLTNCPQVRLCHHAQVTQQDDSCQAVGAALDQELPVWGAVAEDGPQLPLIWVFVHCNRFLMGRLMLLPHW